jgi:hypothetical protein
MEEHSSAVQKVSERPNMQNEDYLPMPMAMHWIKAMPMSHPQTIPGVPV